VALRSSSPVVIAGPDANISAIIALIVAAIVAKAGVSAGAPSLATTIWISLAASSLVAGIFLFLVGKFKLGRWIRFIPYPVVGGFLAGTGWLLVRGSFKVMCGLPLSINNCAALAREANLIHWAPGAIFAVALLLVLRKFRHFLIMPIALVGAIIATHIVLMLAGLSIEQSMSSGWLLSPFPSDLFFRSFSSLSASDIDLSLLMDNAANMIALMIVAAIVILLNAASVELTTHRDMELDRELTTNGIANIIAAPLGALTGCLALSRTILNFKSGATSRIAGIISAVLCGFVLLVGARTLSLFPKPVLGGLLLYIGLSLLCEWVVDGWKKLSRLDYFLVIVIVVIIGMWGFLPGVGIGLVIACMLFAINYSRAGAIKRTLTGSAYRSNVERSFHEQEILDRTGDRTYVLQLQGYVFFGTSYPLLTHCQEQMAASKELRFIVIDFSRVNGMDSSSTLSFSKLLQSAEARNIRVLFAGMQESVARLLEHEECIAPDACAPAGGQCIAFPDIDHALGFCEDALIESEEKALTGPAETFTGYFSSLFARPDLLPRLMKHLERVEADTGFVLFRQNAPSDDLYFVESGEITALLEIGSARKRLRTMGAGTVIGEMGLFLKTNRSATIVTERPSVLYRLSNKSLLTIEETDHQLAAGLHRFFVCLLSRRLAHANAEIALLSQ
jgi:SulP family sulfate permease